MMAVQPLMGQDVFSAEFGRGADGNLVLTATPEQIPEDLIRSHFEQGHRSEIFITFRIQTQGAGLFSIGGEHREIHVRKTGFRDKITGDYILLQNEREIGVYGGWDEFFRNWSGPIVYPVGLPYQKETKVRARELVIYKKLVPPFNIMYLIPGKFMKKSPWVHVSSGEEL